MTRGDHGIPLAIQVKTCIEDEELEEDDVVRVVISKGGRPTVTREVTCAQLVDQEGCMELELTAEETEALPIGLYTWDVALVRGGETHHTLKQADLEVVP